MPDFIPPCLATLSAQGADTTGWVHEIKFDGYRIQARIASGKVTLKTRTGLDWTSKFPAVDAACEALSGHDAILDGEIASIDQNGISDFSALQNDLKNGRHDRMAYYIFDLLHLDGQDLTQAPLIERKRALAAFLAELPKDSPIKVSEHFEEDGSTMIKHACNLHLEGIVSKRADAPYRSGRSGEWLKIKCASNQEFVVIGYEPSDKRGRLIRSLLLGYYDKDGLRYAGRIGTGLGSGGRARSAAKAHSGCAKRHAARKSPREERLRRGVKWVEPKSLSRWISGLDRPAQARSPGFVEGRARGQAGEAGGAGGQSDARNCHGKAAGAAAEDADQNQRGQAGAAKASKTHGVEVAGIRLSHPDRVYWEDAGVTKQMLAEYYTEVWDWMRPHITGRVLALVRCPDGAAGQCFFQKHASAGIDAKKLKLVPDDGDKSITVESVAGLVSLAQAGVLEVHVRGSSTDDLEKADRLVFDLDPGAGVEWRDVIAAAREVRPAAS